MAQPPPYRKSFAIVQALFRKFSMRTALAHSRSVGHWQSQSSLGVYQGT
jgi:hypothetical protein